MRVDESAALDQRWPDSVAVTVKLASSLTVASLPSARVTWASYTAPSASVSMRLIVAPGWAASTAAWTLLRVARQDLSVMPLAW